MLYTSKTSWTYASAPQNINHSSRISFIGLRRVLRSSGARLASSAAATMLATVKARADGLTANSLNSKFKSRGEIT